MNTFLRRPFQPMLAAGWDMDENKSMEENMRDYMRWIYLNVPRPWGVTPKIDGIRIVTRQENEGVVSMTRSLKSVPNRHIREMLSTLPPNLDGEGTCGENFQAVTSGIMTHAGEPPFVYHIFDVIPDDPRVTYGQRVSVLNSIALPSFCRKLIPMEIDTLEDLKKCETLFVARGAEGLMLRPTGSPYKYGRSTLHQGWLLKVKRFVDGEAVVIGYEEEMHNANEAERDERGYQVRSTHAKNMKGKERLGALFVQDLETQQSFHVGTGFTAQQRENMWDCRASLVGRIAKYKYQQHGTKVRPRIPVFQGFRDKLDMGETLTPAFKQPDLLEPGWDKSGK